jgi:photosystem II stability/assembly factor-like uncharacterized protein
LFARGWAKHVAALGFVGVAAMGFGQAPTSWKSVGVGGGGALFAPTFNPFDENEMWLACDMSGQYHSTTLGTAWTLTPFTTLQVGPNSPQVQFTSSSSIRYMVDTTGDNLTTVKSTDGGAIWKPIASDPTGQGAYYLVADPTTTTRVFVASYDTLYFSGNGGSTWKSVATAPDSIGIEVSGALFDGTHIYIGTNEGVLVSTNNGTSFAKLSAPGIPSTEQIVSFAASKSGTTTRFVAVTFGAGQVYSGIGGGDYGNFKNVYTMDYGVSTDWTKHDTGIPSGSYAMFVGMAKGDIEDVYLAGSCDAGVPVVLKSTNGGQSWASTLDVTNNKNVVTGWQGDGGDRGWGYDQLVFGFSVCPTDAKRIAFTGYGFCHISTNGGATWTQVYDSTTTENAANHLTPKGKSYLGIGLENTSSWWIAWADVNNIWASFADIQGIRSTNAGTDWSFNYTGQTLNSSYGLAVGPSGTMYMATSSIHDMYESTHLTDARIDGGTGNVLVSTNKGATWTKLGSLGYTVMAVALDPTNAKRLYATVANSVHGGVYVCQDITKGTSAVWTKCAAPPRTQGHAFNVTVLKDGTVVCTYSGRMAPSFTESSGVFVSTNGGKTWVDRSAPNMLWWTMDLTVDPTDATQDTWLVGVYSGWGGAANNKGGLYRSKNRGVSWTEILDLDRVGSCTVNPKNAKEIYVTTETEGLWYTANANVAAPKFVQLGTYPFRQPTRVFFNPFKPSEIWVTSFGNGVRIGESSGP